MHQIKLFISNKIIASKKLKDDRMDEKQAKILELLEEGKTIEEASKEAKTLEIIVKRWIQLGEDGDERYSEFYQEYQRVINKETDVNEVNTLDELINQSINIIKENKSLSEINEKLKIPNIRIKNWYYNGKLGIEPFDKFYNACLESNIELSDDQKSKMETFKGKELRKKLNELKKEEIDYILEFNEIEEIDLENKKNIEIINKTLTLKEIEVSLKKIDELEQKKNEIREILGKSQSSTLLNLLEEEDRQKYKNSSNNEIINRIIERLKLNEYEEFLELLNNNFNIEIESEEENIRKCKICGKKLSENEKDKCKKCRKKSNTAGMLLELLNSISPEVPFYSDDLKNLGFDKAKINHYIWSLQDYDLIIKEKNNKYSLASQDKLDKFIEIYGEGSKPIESENKVKLSKKCKICNKTLAIAKFVPNESSDDGYGDICKKCKKNVNAANYLKYILKWALPEEPFLKEDIIDKYNKPKTLTAHIWTLQDLDLINYNDESEEYALKNQTVLDKFLEKYFLEEEYEKFETALKKSKNTKKAKKQTLDDFVENAENYKEKHAKKTVYNQNKLVNEKMNLLINSLISGKSIEEACNDTNLTTSIIQSWIRFAKQGNSEYLKFYEDYLAVTTHEVLKEGQTEEEADQEEINEVIDSLRYNPEKHATIIEAIKEGKTINEASKLVNVHINDLIKWYKNGKNGIKPFDSYYSDYEKAREYFENKMFSKRMKNFDDEETQERLNIFINAIKEGKTQEEASELSGISSNTFRYWVNKGNKGEEKYINLAEDYKKVREGVKNKKEEDTAINEIGKNDDRKNLFNNIKLIIVESNNESLEIILKGKIIDSELITTIKELEEFKNKINKILTTRLNDEELEILIELNVNNDQLNYLRKLID